MSTATEEHEKGLRLRSEAMAKISRARDLLESAADDLRYLEGPGYCQRYERTGELAAGARELRDRLRRMVAPSGVFEI